MKIADRVYLITDQLQTGAGIPGVIRAMEDDSMVEVAVEFTHGTKILKVRSCDILPSNGRASISMIFFCFSSFSALKTSLAK